MGDHAEEVVAVGERIVGAGPLRGQVEVGVVTLERKEPGQIGRARLVEHQIGDRAFGAEDVVLELALLGHRGLGPLGLVTVQPLVSLVARLGQDLIGVLARPRDDVVGLELGHDLLAQRPIGVGALDRQATIGLVTLRPWILHHPALTLRGGPGLARRDPRRCAASRNQSGSTKKSGMSGAPGTVAYSDRSVLPSAAMTSSSMKKLPVHSREGRLKIA